MRRARLEELCGSFPGAVRELPFDDVTVAWKVGGRIFALIFADDDPLQCNLKCEPFLAEQLRDEHPDAVRPGYHMDKRHWNTVVVDALPARLVTELVEDSYDLVVDKLPRSQRPAGQ